MAPEADLIAVRIIDGDIILPERVDLSAIQASQGSLIDAAAYIFDQAGEPGRPTVVNASLGYHLGAHDGSSLVEQGLDALLQTPGRVLCAAAGNEGSSLSPLGRF